MERLTLEGQWAAISLSSDGTIRALSSSGEQLLGYSPGDLAGQSIESILSGASAFVLAEMIGVAAECGCWEGKVTYRDRAGQLIEAATRVQQLVAGAYDKSGFLLLAALKPNRQQNDADPRLHEIGAHLRKTTHELNNPLAVMMGFAQLILLDAACEGKVRSDVERIFAEMKRVIQTVESLHSYALSLQNVQPDRHAAAK